jgi:hypothetical protein
VLDQASEEIVERLLSRVSPKTDGLRAMCAPAHCQHEAYIGLTSKHPDNLTKTFHSFKIIFLGHCLAMWKKFMVNNALRIAKAVSMTLTFDRTCLSFLGHGDPSDTHCDA